MGQPQPVYNFVRADEGLSQQFRTFCNWEFSDSICISEPAMSKRGQACTIHHEAVDLLEGGSLPDRINLETRCALFTEQPRNGRTPSEVTAQRIP